MVKYRFFDGKGDELFYHDRTPSYRETLYHDRVI